MAQSLKTPNVYRFEKDLSEITTPAGTSIGAIVMSSRKGVVNERVLITNDKQLIDLFGTPIPDGEDVGIYAGMEYLKEADTLYVVRATSGGEQYADIIISGTSAVTSAGGVGVEAQSTAELIIDAPDGNKPDAIFDLDNASLVGVEELRIACKGPGLYGNDIGITVFNQSITGTSAISGDAYDWDGKYDYPNKIVKISVFSKESTEPLFPTSPEEVFYVSSEYMKDGEGKQLFVKDVINGNSKFIYVDTSSDGSTDSDVFGQAYTTSAGLPVALAGGLDSQAITATKPYYVGSGLTDGWDLFKSRTAVDVHILIDTHKIQNNTTCQKINGIAGARLDCISCVQAGSISTTAVDTIKSARTDLAPNFPSYCAVYTGFDKIYDSFNDRNVFIPKCVFGAVIMARTDRIANTWDAPAGINRGILPSIGQSKTFTDTEIGLLYDYNINTSRFMRGTGNVLWGQKTAQRKKSALDRINVRRLLIYIENSIEPSLIPFLFEPNSAKTRLRAFNVVDNFMNGVLAGGGVTKYEVVCDDTNNTAQTIDQNEMNLDVYVQPTKTIEFIRLNIVVTRTGVSFAEVR